MKRIDGHNELVEKNKFKYEKYHSEINFLPHARVKCHFSYRNASLECIFWYKVRKNSVFTRVKSNFIGSSTRCAKIIYHM